MKINILLIVFLISTNCFSQEKEIKYFSYKWKPTSEKRAKFVRHIEKINDTIYSVTDYDNKGRLYMKGQYSSINPMIENGFFEFYDFDNFQKVATGYYSKGIMCGEWVFKNYNDTISRKVNYDFKIIKNSPEFDTEVNPQVKVESMPKFQNSDNFQNFINYVARNLIYPPMAQRYYIQEKVYIGFIINENGQISDIKAMRKSNKDLEREAIRVLAQSPEWNPGYQKGKPVRVHFVFPFIFELK